MKIRFLQGSIIDARTDAVVLPANPKLKEGSGTSRAIFEAAGRWKLTKKCREIGYCQVGTAVPTLGYNLGEDKIIVHAVVPKWIDGEHSEYATLCSAYTASLSVADKLKCKNIVFPLLSSGNNGFDIDVALECAVESIEAYNPEVLEEVQIVVIKREIVNLIRSKGYEIEILPRNLDKDKSEYTNSKKRTEDMNKMKEAVINNLIEAIQDKDNQEKLLEFGKFIFKSIKNKLDLG